MPVFWPGEFRGLYSPCGHKELDMTEQLSFSLYKSWHENVLSPGVQRRFHVCIILRQSVPLTQIWVMGLPLQSTQLESEKSQETSYEKIRHISFI